VAQSIITNTVIASSGRVINVALGIVALGFISRFLGTDQFGSFTVLLAYGAILQITADLGLYLTLTRAIAQHPAKENHYLTHIISLRLALLITIFGLGAAATFVVPSLRGLLLVYSVVAIGYIAQSFSQLMMGIYQKYRVVWRATAGDIAGRIAQVAGLIIIGASRATLTSMAVLFTVSAGLAALVHRQLLPTPVLIKLAFSWPTWRRLIIGSLPLGALLILNAVYFRIDTVLLSLYRPSGQVGLYGIAYRLIESALFFPAMFGGLLLPRLSSSWQNQQRLQLKQYYEQGLLIIVWAAVFTVISLTFLSQPIILLIAGSEFEAAASLLRILALALAAMFIGNLSGFTLVACQRQKALLKLAVVLAVVNIGLNLLFIPRWGALAAAWTTVITEGVAALSATIIAYRLIHFTIPLSVLVRLALAAVLTALIYQALPATWPVLITLGLGAAVYAFSSWWLRIVTKQNLSLLFTTT